MSDAQPAGTGPTGVDPEAEERAAQTRRRRVRRRQALVFVVVVLLVLGTGVGALAINLGWWDGPFAAQETPPPTATAAPAACPTATTVPVDPAAIRVTVLNSTGRKGLAADVADQLGARGLDVAGIADAAADDTVAGTAQVRFGPEGATAAKGLASLVPGAVLAGDPERSGPEVDLVLGQAYSDLADPQVVPAETVPPDPASVPATCTGAGG